MRGNDRKIEEMRMMIKESDIKMEEMRLMIERMMENKEKYSEGSRKRKINYEDCPSHD